MNDRFNFSLVSRNCVHIAAIDSASGPHSGELQCAIAGNETSSTRPATHTPCAANHPTQNWPNHPQRRALNCSMDSEFCPALRAKPPYIAPRINEKWIEHECLLRDCEGFAVSSSI